MLDSQMSSLKVPLSRLASPDLYYILTGNDFDLAINDPGHPKVLCLGGDPSRRNALAPILSLYVDRLNRLINKPGQYPCVLMLDEFASVRATSLLETVGVGREHNIIPMLVVQDLSQLKILYSHDEAVAILNLAGNLICGQTDGETARWVSERFPMVTQHKTTVSVNSADTSVSKSEQSNPAMSPATLAALSSGEFVGILADDPDKAMT
ncbi:MAG TPA: TraM recognition domain-containing protein, partial [Puia sp.]|nr:TraM recognition domain-containing protein [Puia sp.]